MANELTVDSMPVAADDFVSQAKAATGLDLDYSARSLQQVEQILEHFHSSKDRPEGFKGLLFTCGAYVGEVLRRQHGGRWVALASLPEKTSRNVSEYVTDLPIAFECEGVFLSPYDKVRKRVENGAEDSITHWANLATKKQFVEVRQLGRPKPGFLARLFGRS